MNKISNAQAGQMMKMAGHALRGLSEEVQQLKEKVAHFEKKAHAEKIATRMEEKGIESALTFQEKVAKLLDRADLSVFEEAVEMSAPQMKIASVVEDGNEIVVEGNDGGNAAETRSQRASPTWSS
jgi:hypothetical protein